MGKTIVRLLGDHVEYKLACYLKLVAGMVESGSRVTIKDHNPLVNPFLH